MRGKLFVSWIVLAVGLMLGVGKMWAADVVLEAAANEKVVEGTPEHVTCAAVDQKRNLWIGSEDQGLWRMTSAGDWVHYGVEEGMGDGSIYALFCDRQGRIWAGHLNHGVSVFDGKSWRNYRNFGAMAGPLGVRVYAIAQSPKDGEIWIATEAGISRYSDASGKWSYVTRADGLPEDQVRGLAFDSKGDVYLAMSTEGVTVGRAADRFASWEHVKGPEAMPETASGDGLPGNLANCVAVDRSDCVYVGTTRGLGWSEDHGKTWKFLRGKNWQELVAGQHPEAAEKFHAEEAGVLNEDWINCLAVDDEGSVWVGYREKGYQRLDPTTRRPVYANEEGSPMPVSANGKPLLKLRPLNDVTAILVRGVGERAIICRYVSPAGYCLAAEGKLAPAAVAEAAGVAGFPKPATAMDAAQLAGMKEEVLALKEGPGVAYLGEDWATQGNWVGRYGRNAAILYGISAKAGRYGDLKAYRGSVGVGPSEDGLYSYFTDNIQERRILYSPGEGKRMSGEFNDGTWQRDRFPRTMEGPGMWMRISVPEGVHRVSLYFSNSDAQKGDCAYRDYVLEVRKSDVAADPEVRNLSEVQKSPVLARARINQYWGGVYERFVFNGPGTYWLTLRRNHSSCVKLYATFYDRLGGEEVKTLNDPPAVSEKEAEAGGSARLMAARELRAAIEQRWDRPEIDLWAGRFGVEAYRAAEAAGASEELKAQWRWKMGLWTKEDDALFEKRMREEMERPKEE